MEPCPPANPDDMPEVSLRRQLAGNLVGRICLFGIGNRQRRDDAAGSILAARLADGSEAMSIDAGGVPENYLEKVVRFRPDVILMLDAADFGGTPGDVRLLDVNLDSVSGVSTHALSLEMTAEYLAARTQARVALLAIQPADIGWGTGLSGPVSQAIDGLVEVLLGALTTHADNPHLGSAGISS